MKVIIYMLFMDDVSDSWLYLFRMSLPLFGQRTSDFLGKDSGSEPEFQGNFFVFSVSIF